MVGLNSIEFDVPNSPGIKVQLDLLTFKAQFMQYSVQEYFKNVKDKELRNLNNFPTFDTAFDDHYVYLG